MVSGAYYLMLLCVCTCYYLCFVFCMPIINEFRCYEAKIEESEKDGSRQESNPGHLWLEAPVLCH